MDETFRRMGGGIEGAVTGFMQAASWGTPDKILRGLEARRKLLGDFEMNVAFRFGGTPFGNDMLKFAMVRFLDAMHEVAPDAPAPEQESASVALDAAAAQGHTVTVIAAKEEASPDLSAAAARHQASIHWISIGQLGTCLSLLKEAGVPGFASTQMHFDTKQWIQWLRDERAAGLTLPVHIGAAGAIDRMKLISLSTKLDIGSSVRFLKKNSGAISRLLRPGGYDPVR